MLSEKEFSRLQKLACIQLSEEEKKKLGNQLTTIIDFLDQLKNITISQSEIERLGQRNFLRTLSGIREDTNHDGLIKNIQHNTLNNSIVIKSVLK